MPSRPLTVDELTADERLELMGRLWDSLDPASAPVTDALGAELDRREAEADAGPEDGQAWSDVREALKRKLK